MFPGLMLFSDPGSPDPKTGGPRAERTGFSFSIDEPVSVVSPAVFASPHSGRLYPKGFLEACTAPMSDLRRIEDAYVDRLLSDVHLSGAPVICGLVARACLDLNRAESEMDPLMFEDPAPAWFASRSPRVEAVLVSGHNPGLQDVLLELVAPEAENALFDEAAVKFPTGSFAVLELAIDDWAALDDECGTLVHFVRPRDLDPSLGPERVS
jgi:hypothetical protein